LNNCGIPKEESPNKAVNSTNEQLYEPAGKTGKKEGDCIMEDSGGLTHQPERLLTKHFAMNSIEEVHLPTRPVQEVYH